MQRARPPFGASGWGPLHPSRLGSRIAWGQAWGSTTRRSWPPAWCPLRSEDCPPSVAETSGESEEARLRRLEAVLFLAREPLNSRKLSQYANLADGTEARTLIRRLNAFYDTVGRAFRVEEMAGGFRLMTRPKFGAWLKRLTHTPSEVRLSAPALETLAVVAYRQPVHKAAIEAIRGVQCGEVLRQLMERDLVRIVGRSEELGRPYLYGPTKRFLEVFGLRSLDDLPRVEALRTPSTDAPSTSPTSAADLEDNSHSNHPQQEKLTVRIQDFAEEQVQDHWNHPALTSAPVPVLAADDDEDDYDDYDDEEEDYDDEDLDDEDLDDEGDFEEDDDWEYDEEEDEEIDDDIEDEEWEEVEGDDDDLDEEEDEDWDDEDDDWEDD